MMDEDEMIQAERDYARNGPSAAPDPHPDAPDALEMFKALYVITGYYSSGAWKEHTREVSGVDKELYEAAEAAQSTFAYRVFSELGVDPEDVKYLNIAEELIEDSKIAKPSELTDEP